jgi:hypothetical protein
MLSCFSTSLTFVVQFHSVGVVVYLPRYLVNREVEDANVRSYLSWLVAIGTMSNKEAQTVGI